MISLAVALAVVLIAGLYPAFRAIARVPLTEATIAWGSRLLTAPALVYLGEVGFAVCMVCIPWQLAFAKAAARLLGSGGELLPAPLWLEQLAGVVPAAMLVHHLV